MPEFAAMAQMMSMMKRRLPSTAPSTIPATAPGARLPIPPYRVGISVPTVGSVEAPAFCRGCRKLRDGIGEVEDKSEMRRRRDWNRVAGANWAGADGNESVVGAMLRKCFCLLPSEVERAAIGSAT
jgi:hypothetical protein